MPFPGSLQETCAKHLTSLNWKACAWIPALLLIKGDYVRKLTLGFLICKVGVKLAPTQKDFYADKEENAIKSPSEQNAGAGGDEG